MFRSIALGTVLVLSALGAVDFERPAVVPTPASAKWTLDRAVELKDGLPVRFDLVADHKAAPDWFAGRLRSAFGISCTSSVTRVTATAEWPEEGYCLRLDDKGLEIKARGLRGVRYAFQTLRQMAMPRRGTLRVAGWIAPACEIEDQPALKFRGMHLCWFPETDVKTVERCIRLAGYYKMNYVVLENWGTFRSEKYPWLGWKDGTMTKAELARLRAVAADLGVTLVPQLNIFGHASMSRSQSAKHAVLDVSPEYQPLYEPHDGWNWCLSNPEALKVIDGFVAELHEAFGNPPFFHIGCDEANPPSCPECRARDYVELVAANIARVTKLLEKRGARAMMWHDMLLKKGAWGRFYANASHGEERLLGALPKSIVICDWFYNEGVAPEGYPTFNHFMTNGYDVVSSPWESVDGTAAQAKALRALKGFGILGTTWHHVYKGAIRNQFVPVACGAWGDGEVDGRDFKTHWRQVGWDMGVTDYSDCGYVTEQVPRNTNIEIRPGG